MSTNVYPRWQYALLNGECHSRIIRSPEEENPEVWKETPPQSVPPAEGKPACESCVTLRGEIASMQKSFDAAYKKLIKEHEELKKAHAKLEEERDALQESYVKLREDAEEEASSDKDASAAKTKKSRAKAKPE